MKPRSILLFMVIVLAVIAGTMYFFPNNGIAISEKVTLRFHYNFNQLFQNDSITYADISAIIEQNQVMTDSVQSLKNQMNKTDTLRANARGLKSRIQPIEFAPDDSLQLSLFFHKLTDSQDKPVRILHYGDSQIEGDRITGYLRNLFQKQFGGSGPGLMPAIPGNAESASILHSASVNWIDHSVYYQKDTILPHRRFGVLGHFARFTQYHDDTVGRYAIPQNAWIEFNQSSMAYSSVQHFTQCKVFYGHVNSQFTVKGFVNDSLIWFEEIDTCQKTRYFEWNFMASPKRFRIEFEGIKSPDIYGLTLDAPVGVSVDNLPFRGSSGTEFVRLDHKQLSQMYRLLPAGLIIFEFGVNVVPFNSKSYAFYEQSLKRQLRFLKNMLPGASILVIGVSDMSDKTGNNYTTKPAVTKVIEAQRRAAFSEGCAFWDLYTAMGGNNSMPSWVFAQPPLAQKDFVHFNRAGGHIVAQMLYNAVMSEFDKFNRTKLTADSTHELSPQ